MIYRLLTIPNAATAHYRGVDVFAREILDNHSTNAFPIESKTSALAPISSLILG
jgi:hypothetical protein